MAQDLNNLIALDTTLPAHEAAIQRIEARYLIERQAPPNPIHSNVLGTSV